MVKLEIVKKTNQSLVNIILPETGVISPEDLFSITLPDIVQEGLSDKIIILSGRAPVWLFGFLVHFFHPTKAVAVFDPRLNGAVVVATHSPVVKAGEVLKIE